MRGRDCAKYTSLRPTGLNEFHHENVQDLQRAVDYALVGVFRDEDAHDGRHLVLDHLLLAQV